MKNITQNGIRTGDKVKYVGEHRLYDKNLIKNNIYTVDHIFRDDTIGVVESSYTYWCGSFILT